MSDEKVDLVLDAHAPNGGWLIPRKRPKRDVSESRATILAIERQINGQVLSVVAPAESK